MVNMDFQETKLWLISFFVDLINLLEEIISIVTSVDHTNKLLENIINSCGEEEFIDFNEVYKNLRTNLIIIERNHMKCVLIGQTSNGKSTVANAFLLDKVLPSNKGRTTSCFISVKGCDDYIGYLVDNSNKKQKIELLKEFANEFGSQKCDINALLKVYWPKSNCRLLRNDLEILDSPGIDYTKDSDEWICEYCKDADAFLLVVDGCSVLSKTEKNVLLRVKAQIANPNIFVLVNKWDMIENSVDVEKTKKRHCDDISRFLCQELQLYTSNSVSNRIHFISANETLKRKGTKSFEILEKHLTEEMFQNALITKFQPHINKARRIAFFINHFISRFIIQVTKPIYGIKKDPQTIIRDTVDLQFDIIRIETNTLIKESIPILVFEIQEVVDKQKDLDGAIVDFFENDFPKQLSSIFSKQLKILEDELTKLYVEFWYSDISTDKMRLYFTTQYDFQYLSKKYEECIAENIRNTSTTIRNISKKKEESQFRLINIFETFRSVSRSIALVSKLVPIIPIPIRMAIGAVELVTEQIPTPTTGDIKENFLKEFVDLFSSLTNFYIHQFHKQAILKIEKSTIDFLKHRQQFRQYFKAFKKFRTKIMYQIDDIMNK